jgi:hypothetical protein
MEGEGLVMARNAKAILGAEGSQSLVWVAGKAKVRASYVFGAEAHRLVQIARVEGGVSASRILDSLILGHLGGYFIGRGIAGDDKASGAAAWT